MIPDPPFRVWLGDMNVAERLRVFSLIKDKFPKIHWSSRATSEESTLALFVAKSLNADAIIFCEDKDANKLWDKQEDGLYSQVWIAPRLPTREVDFNLIK